MDHPANVREAERYMALDAVEGADMLMVKPATMAADVIRFVREWTASPAIACPVSAEHAILKAAAQNGWLNDEACLLEALFVPRRAGAALVFTPAALATACLLERAGNAEKR
jgi:porphobilinogen synthase